MQGHTFVDMYKQRLWLTSSSFYSMFSLPTALWLHVPRRTLPDGMHTIKCTSTLGAKQNDDDGTLGT